MQSIDAHLENFRELEGKGTEFVARLRREAFDRFADRGFPSNRLEEWKYTDPSPLARQSFRLAPPPREGSEVREGARTASLGAGCEVVFVNGRFVPRLSTARALPAGVHVGSLASAVAEHREIVEARLGTLADYGPTERSLTALNTAFLHDGAFVHLSRGTALQEPLHLVFLAAPGDAATVTHPRVLVVAEESTNATIIEHYRPLAAGEYWTNAVTEIALGANASVEHLRIQEEAEQAYHIATVAARQEADSRFVSRLFSLGARLARCDVGSVLAGPGTECTFDGLYLAAGQQHTDHHTAIDHVAPHGTSRELYKGILEGKSTAVFNGKVFVREGAQKSDAQQMNRNLLLSKDAEINTKPQLEIFADDVRCSHGATVGQLDEEAIFYLRARGIGSEKARQMLIQAFAGELVERIGIEPLRTRLEQLVLWRFGDRT